MFTASNGNLTERGISVHLVYHLAVFQESESEAVQVRAVRRPEPGFRDFEDGRRAIGNDACKDLAARLFRIVANPAFYEFNFYLTLAAQLGRNGETSFLNGTCELIVCNVALLGHGLHPYGLPYSGNRGIPDLAA